MLKVKKSIEQVTDYKYISPFEGWVVKFFQQTVSHIIRIKQRSLLCSNYSEG